MTIADQFRREGRDIGRQEGIEKTALKALQKGLDMETVARITGLSFEKLEKLKKQLKLIYERNTVREEGRWGDNKSNVRN